MTSSVAFDATALAAAPDDVRGHTMRGIGTYVDGLLRAVSREQREWADAHLRPVVVRGLDTVANGQRIVTRRPEWRRQDIGAVAAWLADRSAARSARPTMWHCLDPNLPLSPLSADRTVRTAYDLIPLHEPAALPTIRRPHRRLAYELLLRGLRDCRLVLAISETTADDIERTLGVPRARIRVVYPALVPSDLPGPSPTMRPEGREPDLLFVGVPDPWKQPELAIGTLVECRRRGHDIRLRFCGYQRPADTTRLRALAAESGVSEHIDFLGRVSRERLVDAYRRGVLLAVSRHEGFGLPAVEALFAGGRVVAGSAPVFRETLGAAADFAVADDPLALADAYESALGRSTNGPPPALVERFSPRSTAAALVSAYEEALG